jgi:hypothetical protein
MKTFRGFPLIFEEQEVLLMKYVIIGNGVAGTTAAAIQRQRW